ncbi:ATP-binding protein [Paraburkholderia sp. A2RI-6]
MERTETSVKRPTSRPVEESERHFRLLADAIPQMVWTTTPAGWCDYVNRQWVTYTGLSFDQGHGWGWTPPVHPDDLQRCIDCWTAAIESGEKFEIEYRWKRASDGAYRWLLGRALPLKDSSGKIVKWFGTMTDIEDQKQVQAAAERANQAKSDFLSGMSHELRSPLNAILGFAQLLASETPPPTPSQRTSIDQILHAGWHLLKLINEVLDLAKIESGGLSISHESVLLSDTLLECRAMIEPQAQTRGIRLLFPQFDIPYFVRADPTRLKQILLNLLTNAVKYNSTPGEVEVRCSASTPERVRVTVRDSGAGLSPEQIALLFRPFNRLGQEAGPEEGTGIGLVVSKRLVELMSGTIGADSKVGVGSTFWIELNSAPAPDASKPGIQPAAPPAIQAPETSADSSIYTVLYVEDDPANLKLVEQLVGRSANFRLLSAVTGRQGLELARASLPKVIVMDINLPDMSGVEVLRILREDPATMNIPVIALSANAMPGDIQMGLQSGFFRYLTKPIKLNQFMETLNLLLTSTESGGLAKHY